MKSKCTQETFEIYKKNVKFGLLVIPMFVIAERFVDINCMVPTIQFKIWSIYLRNFVKLLLFHFHSPQY